MADFLPPARTPVLEMEPLNDRDFVPSTAGAGGPEACLRRRLCSWLQRAAAESGVAPKDLLILSGIEGRPDPTELVLGYGARGLGKNAAAFCLGARAANPGLRAVVFMPAAGGSGMGGLLGAVRLGLDATWVILNGGCKAAGPAQPDILALALSAGAGFAARVCSRTTDEEGAGLFARALQHKGASVLDCAGPCPACDGEAAAAAFPVDTKPGEARDRAGALARAAQAPAWAMGLLLDAPGVSWEEREPALARRGAPALLPAGMSPEERESLWECFR